MHECDGNNTRSINCFIAYVHKLYNNKQQTNIATKKKKTNKLICTFYNTYSIHVVQLLLAEL